jgi:Patched family
MHTMLRYFESTKVNREDRVRETLTTMGVSILLGALSTFLGSVPLLFSQSAVFRTLYKAFFAMIILGLAHGLILLPVLLSLFGTEAITAPLSDRDKAPIETVRCCGSESPIKEDDSTDGSSFSGVLDSSNDKDWTPFSSSPKTSNEESPPGSIQSLNVNYVCQPSQTYDQYEVHLV